MRGYIYVIEAEDINRIKIGRTSSHEGVLKRIKTFQCGSPCTLEVHSVSGHENCVTAESFYHRRFSSARLRGEWFDSNNPRVASWLVRRIEQGFGYQIDLLAQTPINGDRGRPAVALFAAIEFLIGYLDGGQEVLARVTIQEARTQGISTRTLEAAKRKLQVKSIKRQNEWWWVLD